MEFIGATTSIEPTWRTSTYTGNTGQCVEVGPLPSAVAVRDTKRRTGPVLMFPSEAFEQAVRALAN
ncbi:DUF397 domain-containing protein [Embleya sp. NPDC001921]